MTKIAQLVLYFFLLFIGSCARIQPVPDFQRAQSLVRQSTGIDEFYQPHREAVSNKVLAEQIEDGLTLDEALRIALMNNRKLQREVLEIGVSHAELVQAGMLSNPVFSLLLKFPDSGGRSNLEASIGQSVSDLWKLPSRKRAAKGNLDLTILDVVRGAGELVAEVTDAYYESLAASLLVETASERVALAKEVHRAVRVLKEAGVVGALDENLASGELLRAELEFQESEFAERRAFRALALILSLEIHGNMLKGKLSDPEDGINLASCSLENTALISLAQTKRFDLRALSEAVKEADAHVSLEQWSILPDLDLGATVERPEKLSGEEDSGVDYLLGPQLSLGIPIFDQKQAQVSIAKFRKAKAQKNLEAAKLNVVQEIDEAIDRVKTASRAYEFFNKKLLPQAESNLDYARVSYEGGESSLLTLIESQRSLLDGRRGLIDAKLQVRKALVELEKTLGTPIEPVCKAKGG